MVRSVAVSVLFSMCTNGFCAAAGGASVPAAGFWVRIRISNRRDCGVQSVRVATCVGGRCGGKRPGHAGALLA